MNETWKAIPGIEEYEASFSGLIRSVPRLDTIGRKRKGVIISQFKGPFGYLYVTLYIKGRRINRSVAKLVADAFLDNPNSAKAVRHIDGDILNNRADNLRWNERKER